MGSLDRFQQSRCVIEDFTSRTLAVIPTEFGRLYYISSLKDGQSGGYRHDGLVDVYSQTSVQDALEQCHKELFSRILETSLKEQESDLRTCLDSAGGIFWTIVENWRETRSFETMCPESLPGYLRDLFCSNLAVLLATLSAQRVILDRAS